MGTSLPELLKIARRVASVAMSQPGFALVEESIVSEAEHVGALIADASLQAGLSYAAVVLPRVRRIRREYPHLTSVTQVRLELSRVSVFELLQCRNTRKAQVFSGLTEFLSRAGVDTTAELRIWATCAENRAALMTIHGVGPKTSDYLALLAGVDVVPVDRHISALLMMAGAPRLTYRESQAAFSYAADLLNVRRRSLDRSVWRHFSARGRDFSLWRLQ